MEQASLTGAALRAGTVGVLAPDGGLTFKLDWSADGPFEAGPIEIAGKAKGSGAITGTLAAPRADLLADFAEIDIPRLPLKDAHLTLSFLRRADGASGMVALTATSAYGPARARADFQFPQGGVDLTDLSVDAGGVKASGLPVAAQAGAVRSEPGGGGHSRRLARRRAGCLGRSGSWRAAGGPQSIAQPHSGERAVPRLDDHHPNSPARRRRAARPSALHHPGRPGPRTAAPGA